MNRPDRRLIASTHGITREAKHIADPEGMGSQQVGLKSDAIPVATCNLQNRLQAHIEQQTANGETAHAHHRPAAIGDIDGMDAPSQALGHGKGFTGITSPWRHHLSGEGEGTSLKAALQRGIQSKKRF